MFLVLPLIWITIFISFYYYNRLDFIRKGNRIPTPPGLPFVGHALCFLGGAEKFLKRFKNMTSDFDGIFALWFGPCLNVIVYEADKIEDVLKVSRDMEKAYQYKFIRPWLGEGLIVSSGLRYRESKKILVKSFNISILKDYIRIFNDLSDLMIESVKTELDKEEFNIDPYISMCMLRILLETSLGVNKDTMSHDETLAYGRSVEKLGHFVHIRTCKAWLYPDFIFRFSSLRKSQDHHLKIVNHLTNRVISKRRAEYELTKNQGNPKDDNVKKWNKFVDSFFEGTKENGENFTEKEIKDEVMTILFAGQDTTSASIGFLLSMLAIHQDIQEKTLSEILGVLGDSGKSITYEDVQKMKYLEQVIQETWRLFPPVPLIGKNVSKEANIGGHVIPQGSTAVIAIMLLHRDPKQFPNPNAFDPDRFQPDKIKERHPYSFIPFSANYRACIGSKYAILTIKIFVANFLRNYKVFSKRNVRDFTLIAQATLKRKEGQLIRLQMRNTQSSIKSK